MTPPDPVRIVAKRKGIGGHQRAYAGESVEWLTPPEIVTACGPFDLDPCTPAAMPWRTAGLMLCSPSDGMAVPWSGCVWLNPPYGPDTGRWLEKLANHGDGIACIFARTETDMFFRFGWERASAMLFLRGRLHFHRVDGIRAKANAGGPTVLIAYGARCRDRLAKCGLAGKLVELQGDANE